MKSYIAYENYVDELTPVVILEFCICQIVDFLMLN